MTPKVLPEALIEELLAAAEKATPGRRGYIHDDDMRRDDYVLVCEPNDTPLGRVDACLDAEFIAECDPATIIALIAEVKAARALSAPPSRVLPEAEPVAWQWSDFSGQWYTVDTARMALAEQEELARLVASKHEGRVRPLYAAPPGILPSPTEGSVGVSDQPLCEDCNGEVLVWFAPNKLWNLVKGGPDATDDPGGQLCPNCFIKRAEAAGVNPTAWVIDQEQITLSPAISGGR